MIEVNEALNLVNIYFKNNESLDIALENSINHILSENLQADRDYPPFDRVMMDGIAIKYSAIINRRDQFSIKGISPAGSPQLVLNTEDECIEVMTGTILPEGADLVIPYEEVKITNEIASIDISQDFYEKQNVHLMGSDIKQGELILNSGNILNGPHIGIAASIGKSNIRIKKDLKINIISTGNELVPVNHEPLSYQIRRSNSWAIKSSLELFGFKNVDISHIDDDLKSIKEHFTTANSQYDVLMYSGGVSKGKFDYLPKFWESEGVVKLFHQVKQRPGKPLWFGVDDKNHTAIFGMPGNPVSTLVCLHRYFLKQRDVYVELLDDIIFDKDLTLFLPIKIHFSENAKIYATPLKIKNSGEFSALAESDGFIELPRDKNEFKKGEFFKFFSWRPL